MQVLETRLCVYRPTFIGALEHSQEDIHALLTKLNVDPESVPFHRGNPTKRSARYDALYPSELRPAVMNMFKDDFGALGYSTHVSCA